MVTHFSQSLCLWILCLIQLLNQSIVLFDPSRHLSGPVLEQNRTKPEWVHGHRPDRVFGIPI
jgi:hypothetical protein